MPKIRKAIFPVAGLGTRFLPATKAIPKEMLPVVDKPLIQYAVEEAIDAGITELIFIIGRTKNAIADHFDKSYELENELLKHNKADELKQVQNILPASVSCIYIRQAEPLGLGHAVLCGRVAVGKEPFAVILADDLIAGQPSCLTQMVAVFEGYQGSVIAVENIAKTETDKYGIISLDAINERLGKLNAIVEKPKPADAPSTNAVVGRYILTPAIFDVLQTTQTGAGGEIQLTDAISQLIQQEKIYSLRFSGKRYDCGAKLGYLQANIAYALKHPELQGKLAKHLADK